jgi:uncharacterized membrane protein
VTPVAREGNVRPALAQAAPGAKPLQGGPPVSGSALSWRELALVAFVALLGLILPTLPAPLRIPIALFALLVVPGYALVGAVFSPLELPDWIERLGLALACSLALIILQALVLDRALGGLHAQSIRNLVTISTLVFVAIAAFRKSRGSSLPTPTERPIEGSTRIGRAARFTRVIVVVNFAVAALAYGLTVGTAPPSPTEFYVLGSEGKVADYPREQAVGGTLTVDVGISQASDASGSYRIVVRRGETVLRTVEPVDVATGSTWTSAVVVRLETPGRDQELTIDLERAGEARPHRTLRLWVDVRDSGAP